MKNFRIVLSSLAFALIGSLSAQETQPASEPASGTTTAGPIVWSIGLSGVVVDDDGQPFNNLFNVGDSWNFLPFPTRISVDAAIDNKWSFEAALAYSTYKTGKIVNDMAINEDHMFVAFDANAKYHFIPEPKIFDPYGVGGLGFTFRSNLQEQTPTLNLGLGTNIWFIKCFGLNLQTTAKVKMNSKSSNYLMHSLGLVYRFCPCK